MTLEKISDEELKETITRERIFKKEDLLKAKEGIEKEILEMKHPLEDMLKDIDNKLALFSK